MSAKPLSKQARIIPQAAMKAPLGLPRLLAQAGTVAAVTLGADALINLVQRSRESAQFSSGYKRMLAANPDLHGADAQKVMDRYRILSRFGPTLAKDPVVSGDWIKQTLEYPVVTPTVLRDVVDVESRARDLFGGGGKGRQEAIKSVASHLSKGLAGNEAGGILGSSSGE